MNWRQRIAKSEIVKQAKTINLGEMEFNGELLPFQTVGVGFHKVLGRSLNADSTGLGKTVQALGLIAKYRANFEDDGRPIIIFTKTGLLNQFNEECVRFTNLMPTSMRGNLKRRSYLLAKNPELILCSYELFVRYPRMFDSLANPFLVILDEASSIKTHSAKTSIAIKNLTARSVNVLAMSATPVETKLADIHSILEACHTPALPDWEDFKTQFVRTRRIKGSKYGRAYDFEKIVGYRNLEGATKYISPFMLRRTRRDVAGQLPEVVTSEQLFTLQPKHKQSYARMKGYLKQNGINGFGRIPQLQQIVNFYQSNGRQASPKLEYIIEELKNDLNSEKVVIHTRFIDQLKLILNELHKNGISADALYGDVDIDRRTVIQNKFNTEENPRVIVMSNVGIQGLNLQAAGRLFVFDTIFNPKTIEQLIGRLTRISSEHAAVVLTLMITEGTFEEEIYKVLSFREKLAMFITDDSDSLLFDQELNKKELLRALQ